MPISPKESTEKIIRNECIFEVVYYKNIYKISSFFLHLNMYIIIYSKI